MPVLLKWGYFGTVECRTVYLKVAFQKKLKDFQISFAKYSRCCVFRFSSVSPQQWIIIPQLSSTTVLLVFAESLTAHDGQINPILIWQ